MSHRFSLKRCYTHLGAETSGHFGALPELAKWKMKTKKKESWCAKIKACNDQEANKLPKITRGKTWKTQMVRPNQASDRLRYNLLSRMGKDNCAKFGSVIPGSGLVLYPLCPYYERKKIISGGLSLLSLGSMLAITLCTLHSTVCLSKSSVQWMPGTQCVSHKLQNTFLIFFPH